MPATATKKRPAAPEPEAGVLTAYPTFIPSLDAPPASAFWRCHCGTLLLERLWHHATSEMPAHWEICEPPITAVFGREHTQEDCARRAAQTATPPPGSTDEGACAMFTEPLGLRTASIAHTEGEETTGETAMPPHRSPRHEGTVHTRENPTPSIAERRSE